MAAPGSGGPFYFAWVDAADSTFSESYCLWDETIVNFSLVGEENQFEKLEVTFRNPRVGFLASGRKQWVWFSVWDSASATVKPLFFGRIVAIPSNLFAELVTVQFIARSADWIAKKQDLAETLKTRPGYDPIFYDDKSRNDADAIIDGWGKAYYCDRLTHEWSTVDILEGTSTKTISTIIDGSVSFDIKDTPLVALRCDATVHWPQNFRGVTIPIESGIVKTYTGGALIQSWPKVGDPLGSTGWIAAPGTYAVDVDGTEFLEAHSETGSFQDNSTKHHEGDVISAQWSATIPPQGIQINYTATADYASIGGSADFLNSGSDIGSGSSGDDTSASVRSNWSTVLPWRVATGLVIQADGAANQFTETLSFRLNAGLQAVFAEVDDQADVEVMEFNSIDVGEAYIDVKPWTTIAGEAVALGQVIQPNVPAGPGGLSFQICIGAGTAGSTAPLFSDFPGVTTTDSGGVVWASLGASLPTIAAWPSGMYVRKGTVICDVPGGGTFFVCTGDGYTGTSAPIWNRSAGSSTSDNGATWKSLGAGGPSLIVPIGEQPGNVTAHAFFSKNRGAWAVEFMLSKAKSKMRQKARCIEIGFDIPFFDGLDVTCAKSAAITWEKLPGGAATGKIIRYELKGDRTGSLRCRVTIGCAVGAGGSISSDTGSPTYVSADALGADTQQFTGVVVTLGDVGYTPPPPDETFAGFQFPITREQVVLYASWLGSFTNQQNAIIRAYTEQAPNMKQIGYGSAVQARANNKQAATDQANKALQQPQNSVYFTMKLRPISGNEVMTPYIVDVTNLVVPKQIDLEAA